MKVVILAGGFGTRLAELTESVPKPIVPIGGRPILWHIMKIYAAHGFNDFVVALGYKADLIKQYFLNYASLSSDFTVNLKTGDVIWHNPGGEDWRVTLVDTGLNTMTGGRVLRLREFIGNETFMLTYGDGVADLNISELFNFHCKHGKLVTVTTVRPSARFCELDVIDDVVHSFKEKPQTSHGWINGGFFVVDPEFINLIESDATVLEREPLERVVGKGELVAFKHEGFWQCMDTVRDRSYLEDLWAKDQAPWKLW